MNFTLVWIWRRKWWICREMVITCEAASEAQSSRTGARPFDGSGVDVNCKCLLKNQCSSSSAEASQKKRKAVTRKEVAKTQDNMSCQDMEADNDKSLEDVKEVETS